MKTPAVKALSAFIFIGASLVNGFARAEGLRDSQINVRAGYISGHFDGTIAGEFDVPAALDMDWEFFLGNNRSYLFRFITAQDHPDSRPFYNYAGMGMRFYFDTKARRTIQSESDISIRTISKFRYFVGTDLGISQVIVKSFGPVIQAVASMADAGLNVGAFYQMTDKVSLNAQVGKSVFYGLSSTQATGDTTRALLGIGYYF